MGAQPAEVLSPQAKKNGRTQGENDGKGNHDLRKIM